MPGGKMAKNIKRDFVSTLLGSLAGGAALYGFMSLFKVSGGKISGDFSDFDNVDFSQVDRDEMIRIHASDDEVISVLSNPSTKVYERKRPRNVKRLPHLAHLIGYSNKKRILSIYLFVKKSDIYITDVYLPDEKEIQTSYCGN